MHDLFSLSAKIALVTGGNGGIGKAVARAFVGAGANVVIAGRNERKNEETVNEIETDCGVKITAFRVDLMHELDITEMIRKVVDVCGSIHILVNNAGMNIRKKAEDYTISEWDYILNTNVRSAFLCSRGVYPHMKAQGGGKIICIGSMTSLFGAPRVVPYCASKGAMLQMARGLAVDWAADNIQVNAILPGFVNTALTRRSREEWPDFDERVLSGTPAGRWAQPEDLAGTAIFLASKASDFLTGVALPVDGGYSIRM